MEPPKFDDVFKTSLDECFGQFQSDLEAVVNSIAQHANGRERMGPIKKLVEAARDLHDYLGAQYRPVWLQQIYQYGRTYLQDPNVGNARHFLDVLLKHYPSVRQIQFADDVPLIDFDGLFEKYRDSGEVA